MTRAKKAAPAIGPAPYNPRTITEGAREALRASLAIFGDLSGFVVNRKTGHIVCGHQRKAVLPEIDFAGAVWEAKRRRVELGPEGGRFASSERQGFITGPGGARFHVREVAWPLAFEQAANLAANSPRLQGDFTDDALGLLEEISAELPEIGDALEMPDLAADLAGMEAAAGDTIRQVDREPEDFDVSPPEGKAWILAQGKEADVALALDGLRALVKAQGLGVRIEHASHEGDP